MNENKLKAARFHCNCAEEDAFESDVTKSFVTSIAYEIGVDARGASSYCAWMWIMGYHVFGGDQPCDV